MNNEIDVLQDFSICLKNSQELAALLSKRNASGTRKSYEIPKNIINNYPTLAVAYKEDEYNKDGIPFDFIEILNKDQKNELPLNKGKYRIVIKNRNYMITNDYVIKINQSV